MTTRVPVPKAARHSVEEGAKESPAIPPVHSPPPGPSDIQAPMQAKTANSAQTRPCATRLRPAVLKTTITPPRTNVPAAICATHAGVFSFSGCSETTTEMATPSPTIAHPASFRGVEFIQFTPAGRIGNPAHHNRTPRRCDRSRRFQSGSPRRWRRRVS